MMGYVKYILTIDFWRLLKRSCVMDKRAYLLATLSALALGAGVGSTPATAATTFAGIDLHRCLITAGKSEPECACEAALDSGKASVLASFFDIYSEEYKDTACAALATTLVIPPDDREGPRDGNYGG